MNAEITEEILGGGGGRRDGYNFVRCWKEAETGAGSDAVFIWAFFR